MSRPQNVCHHHLFLDLLDADSTVVDLGAYEGEFAREVSRRTGARVLAVEANPVIFEEVHASGRVEKLNLAVGDREGTLQLHLGSDPLGTSVFAQHPATGEEVVEVPSTTLERLIEEHCGGRLDAIKVNIEGAEIPMLRACSDATLQAIPQITIQFHDFLPELDQVEDVREAKVRLHALGFGEILFKAPNKDVLFVNLRAGVMGEGRFRMERRIVRLRQLVRAARKKWS